MPLRWAQACGRCGPGKPRAFLNQWARRLIASFHVDNQLCAASSGRWRKGSPREAIHGVLTAQLEAKRRCVFPLSCVSRMMCSRCQGTLISTSLATPWSGFALHPCILVTGTEWSGGFRGVRTLVAKTFSGRVPHSTIALCVLRHSGRPEEATPSILQPQRGVTSTEDILRLCSATPLGRPGSEKAQAHANVGATATTPSAHARATAYNACAKQDTGPAVRGSAQLHDNGDQPSCGCPTACSLFAGTCTAVIRSR